MKPDDLGTCIAGLASAQISLFGILFKHLENRLGSEIKRDFADELGRIMDIAEQSGQPIQPFQRIIFEHIADWLKSPDCADWLKWPDCADWLELPDCADWL